MSSGMERVFDQWREENEKINSRQVGVKHDGEKPDYSLMPFGALDEVVKVLTYGAKKYDRFNWRFVERHRYEAAALRHISAYQQGEKFDPETGINHLAHAMCSLLFLVEFDRESSAQNGYIKVTTEKNIQPAVYTTQKTWYNNGYDNVTLTVNGMKYETK